VFWLASVVWRVKRLKGLVRGLAEGREAPMGIIPGRRGGKVMNNYIIVIWLSYYSERACRRGAKNGPVRGAAGEI